MTAPMVHVIDDDPAIRDSLRWLLESDGFAVRTYTDAENFLACCRHGQPGCLLVDVRMPGMSGLQLQEELLSRKWRVPLVFITAHGDVPMAVQAVRNGALDFIEKPFDDEALIALIRRAMEIDSEARAQNEQELGFAARLSTLTPRERDVLDGIIAGGSNRVIASGLGITIKTVETHRARIMAKLGVDSVVELVERMVVHRLAEQHSAPLKSPPK